MAPRLIFILVCLSFAGAVCAGPPAAWAAEEKNLSRKLFEDDSPEAPWHIQADEIQYDSEKDEYIAIGNVVITRGPKRVTGDFVRFDHQKMLVKARGNVVVSVGEDRLTGETVEMDLATETGTVYDGTVFLRENNFIIRAETIQKTGADTYVAEKASVSSCTGDRPAWKITGRRLKVTLEGYGILKHGALWARSIPVMYVPFMVFPAKLERQSGFLAPQFGYTDRFWEYYIQPYFWAINDQSDATFYVHHMGRRGEKLGAEYRYILEDRSLGTVMFDFFDDRKVDDGEIVDGAIVSNDEWGYDDDRFLRPNEDRYWFRMKHDQVLPGGFFAKLDLDVVSDQDYLDEFEDGYTGYDETDRYFVETFGRGLDPIDDPVRLNRLNLSNNWDSYILNIETRWFDDVIKRRRDEPDNTLQMLPFVGFTGVRQAIGKSPLYWDFQSEYVNFYRLDGLRGHRIDLHPRIYWPWRVQNLFTLEPSIGLRETVWQTYNEDESREDFNDFLTRELFDFKLDLFTEIFRLFALEKTRFDALRHGITPHLVYEYTPDYNQDEFPEFDLLDRLEPKNQLTYSLISTLIGRSRLPTSGKEHLEAAELPGLTSRAYSQVLRLKLEQSYLFEYPLADGTGDENRHFSPIEGRIDFTPTPYLSFWADTDYSVYGEGFLSSSTGVWLSDKRGDRLTVGYSSSKRYTETLTTNLLFNITDRVAVYNEYERNLKDDQDILLTLGLLYQASCWSLDVRYSEEEDDQEFAFFVTLYGLGGIGTSVAGLGI